MGRRSRRDRRRYQTRVPSVRFDPLVLIHLLGARPQACVRSGRGCSFDTYPGFAVSAIFTASSCLRDYADRGEGRHRAALPHHHPSPTQQPPCAPAKCLRGVHKINFLSPPIDPLPVGLGRNQNGCSQSRSGLEKPVFPVFFPWQPWLICFPSRRTIRKGF